MRILKLFIWAGCGCHKDLNTVHGANMAMMAWWDGNNIPGPVLLANRDNKAVLEDYDPELDRYCIACSGLSIEYDKQRWCQDYQTCW